MQINGLSIALLIKINYFCINKLLKLNTMQTKIQIKKNTQETRNLLAQLIRQNIPVGFVGYVLYSQFNKVYSTDVSDWRKYDSEGLDIQVCATIQGWNDEKVS